MPEARSRGNAAAREALRDARAPAVPAMSKGKRKTAAAGDITMDLQAFFPYRLAVLAEQVSLAVAPAYAARFRLSRQEWRILAVVGPRAEISTTEVCRTTTLDKMQASRAIQSLEQRGFVRRFAPADDRRRKTVAPTAAGRALYRRIVPLASQREAAILRALSSEELAQFNATMTKIAAAAVAVRAGAAE